MIWVEVFRN